MARPPLLQRRGISEDSLSWRLWAEAGGYKNLAATADIVISLDGDGQHPPSLIPEMLRLHDSGFDIVKAQRTEDVQSQKIFKRITSRWFYRIVNAVGEVNLVEGVSDFRLLSRRA